MVGASVASVVVRACGARTCRVPRVVGWELCVAGLGERVRGVPREEGHADGHSYRLLSAAYIGLPPYPNVRRR